MIFLIFLGFLNAKDIEALRDHYLAIIERAQQCLRILNRDQVTNDHSKAGQDRSIPDGAWKDEPASQKQIATLQKGNVELWDGITKGEASKLIDELFKRNKR